MFFICLPSTTLNLKLNHFFKNQLLEFSLYNQINLGDDEVVKRVVVGKNQVLLDVHQLICHNCLELTEFFSQQLQAALKKLVDRVTCNTI